MLCARHLSLHEHISMEIMKKYGVNVPNGDIAITPEQARDQAERFGMGNCIEEVKLGGSSYGNGVTYL